MKFFNLSDIAKDDSFLALQTVRKKIGCKSWTTFLQRERERGGHLDPSYYTKKDHIEQV